jgi:hypothetical protein
MKFDPVKSSPWLHQRTANCFLWISAKIPAKLLIIREFILIPAENILELLQG